MKRTESNRTQSYQQWDIQCSFLNQNLTSSESQTTLAL